MLNSNFIFLLALAVCSGCQESGPGIPGTAELGTGTDEFFPLGETQAEDLELVSGIQGGHHFEVHTRISDMDVGDPNRPGLRGNPETTFSAFYEDGTQLDLMLPPYRNGYVEQSDGFAYLPVGATLIVDDSNLEELYGQRIRLVVVVVDAEGDSAEDVRWVIAKEAVSDDS